MFFAGWLQDLPPVAARLIVVGGLLYVGGAAGVEVVGGLLMLSAVTWLGGTRGRPPAPAMTGIPSTGYLTNSRNRGQTPVCPPPPTPPCCCEGPR